MSQILDPINIVILVIAVVVLYRLYAVLGERTGSEEPPPERPAPREAPQPERADNVIPMPGAAPRPEDAVAREDTALDRALAAIVSGDRHFDRDRFLEGAAAAYEMIVTSFAEGDKRALKPLLSAEVYDGFQKAIDDRAQKGEQVSVTFVGLDSAEIVEAATQGRLARIKVHFVSKMINVTRDRAGEVIAGDPQRIDTLHDGWTFERTMGTSDPNWVLVATESME